MFGIQGKAKLASDLQESLMRAAAGDRLSSSKNVQHKDGWGGVWLSGEEQKYYRTTRPIFEDQSARNFFDSKSVTIWGLSHARAAAKGEPIRNPLDSHPFAVHCGEDLLYITHNGHIAKERISSSLGIDPLHLNDTEVFALLVANMEGDVQTRLERATRAVSESGGDQGGLNLLALRVSHDGTTDIRFYSDFPDSDKELYYSLYVARFENGAAVMSSTVALEAGLIGAHGEVLNPNLEKVPLRQWYKL